MICASLPRVDTQPQPREREQVCLRTVLGLPHAASMAARRHLDRILDFEKTVLNLKDQIPLGGSEDFRSVGRSPSAMDLLGTKKRLSFTREQYIRKVKRL